MSKKISTLAVGAKVRDPLSKYYGVPVGFQIADKNHAGYPANSTTLAAEKILCLKAFDAKESGGNSDRQNYGNNRYSLANIRQWLNKSGTNWYQAQHSYDRAPGSSYVWSGYNAYDTEAGFKTGFSPQFLAAILPTTLTVAKPTTDGGGSETVTDDFFLPSKQEVGLGSENGIAEGSLLALFNSNNSSRLRTCTPQAIANSNYTNNPSSADNWFWRLRSPYSGDANNVRVVYSDGSEYHIDAYNGYVGVLPLCNLSSDTLVSDEPDSEGYYTIQWNQAPTTPPGITVPDSVKSGKDAAISWAASTDPESDDITYQLDRWSNNTNAWATIYTGSNTSFTDTGITTAMDSVQWRVRAKDSKDAYSAYTTSQVKTVTHNADPTVSGADANLGAVTSPPSRAYTVGDVDDGDTLTIVEALDGSEVRTIADAERGKTYTFGLTAAQFAALAAGEHSMTITVTDSAGNSATRVVTFSRSITMISVQRDAIETDAMAEKILISARFLGAENNLTVEACNNAKDATPTWETVTPGRKHLFTNKTKTATKWAVGVRVKLTKASTSDTIALYGVSGSYL